MRSFLRSRIPRGGKFPRIFESESAKNDFHFRCAQCARDHMIGDPRPGERSYRGGSSKRRYNCEVTAILRGDECAIISNSRSHCVRTIHFPDKHLFSPAVLSICSIHPRASAEPFDEIVAKRFRFHPQSNHSLPAQFDSNIRARAPWSIRRNCVAGIALSTAIVSRCHRRCTTPDNNRVSASR